MRIAIMQPYFFPYIGYFQLINAVDIFVIYDNIQFTKKGWMHRNRILMNGMDIMISIPIKKASDYLDVRDRELANNIVKQRKKMLNQIQNAYKEAPYFDDVFSLVQSCLFSDKINLFQFIHNSLLKTIAFLRIDARPIISSSLPINHQLKGQDKVIAICKALNADHYINPFGGIELYDSDTFKIEGITLSFLRPHDIKYKQFGNVYIPSLSIIDVMMFNQLKTIQNFLTNFELIE